MKRLIFLSIVLFPIAALHGQKPDCESIRDEVVKSREEIIEPLQTELRSLSKLRSDLRRGKATLPGDDGKKSKREQFKILSEKIDAVQSKIEKAKSTIKLSPIKTSDLKVGAYGSFGMGDLRDFVVHQILDDDTFIARLSYPKTVKEGMFYRQIPTTGSTLYLVDGIPTKGKADGKLAQWTGHIYCSGTTQLDLNTGPETVHVFKPLDIENCLKKTN